MKSLKEQAQLALDEQQPRTAKQLLLNACKSNPKDTDAWYRLGIICGQIAEYREAAEYFRKVIKLMPNAFLAWENLGIALMSMGNYDEAEKCYRKVQRHNKDSFSVLCNLGNLRHINNQPQEAAKYYKSALQINPSYATAHNNLGLVLRETDDIATAAEHFRKAIQVKPDYAEAYHNLGDTLSLGGDKRSALSMYKQALSLNPGLAESHLGIAAICEKLNYKDKALSHYRAAYSSNPGMVHALCGIVRMMVVAGNLREALELINNNIHRFPNDPDIAAEKAGILILERMYNDAMECIQPFINTRKTSNNIILAYASIARQPDQVTRAIDLMEKIAYQNALSPEGDSIKHALGKLYETTGDYEKAFRYHSSANDTGHEQSDLEQHITEMVEIKSVFNRDFLSSFQNHGIDSKKPVFIVGMPRSGTSLVEQILASHPDIFGGGELTYLWEITRSFPTGHYPASVTNLTHAQVHAAAKQYLERICVLAGTESRITDKLPHNFLHIGLIDLLFHGARIIHCTRDPRDTCISIFFHKFNLNHIYSRDLAELGTYYRHYEKLMTHWKSVARTPILEVNYETLVSDFNNTVRQMVKFCGLPWNQACLDFHKSDRIVRTPSFDQVSKPLYTDSIGRWKHYEHHLKELNEALNKSG